MAVTVNGPATGNQGAVSGGGIPAIGRIPNTSKTVGLSPATMPTFGIKERFRLTKWIARTVKDVRLSNRFFDYTHLLLKASPSDGGVITSNAVGFRLTPFDGSTPCASMFRTLRVPYGNFETCLMTISRVPTDTATGEISLQVGLAKDVNNWAAAKFDIRTAQFGVEYRVAGTLSGIQSAATMPTLAAGDKVGVVLCGVYMTPIVIKADGTEYVGTPVNVATGGIDFRIVTNLDTDYAWHFGQTLNGAANYVEWQRMEVGPFGGVGMRDPSWVKYEDGTPYNDNGLFYFTATVAGLGSGPTPYIASHMGIFSFDPQTMAITQTGRVLMRVSNSVYGHHAGQIVRDRIGNVWMITATSFGVADTDTTWKIYGVRSVVPDVLHTFFRTYATLVTFAETSVWDAYWLHDGTQWVVAYTKGDGAVSRVMQSNAATAAPFTVAAGTMLTQDSTSREGTKLVNSGGGTIRLVAGKTGSNQMDVYTVNPLAVESAGVTLPAVAGTAPAAHFDILPWQRMSVTGGNITEYYGLLFDVQTVFSVSYSWGSTYVCKNGIGTGTLQGHGFDYVYQP